MIEDKIKIEQTSWKEIRREAEKGRGQDKPRYFAYLEPYKAPLGNTIMTEYKDREYAIAFSNETAKLFEKRGYYELIETLFASSLRSEKLPIFYCSHEKDLTQKTLRRLFEIYK